ncbi:MAG: PEP-CTERM sorting domain-containing protein [Rhodocyclaceae bacterium]|nr:PEP-CTERM sorting domain-containing protein [Rhodocyclaceae bacterium]
MNMFSKSTVLAGVATVLLGFSMSPAVAATGFTGAYAFGNWTQTLPDATASIVGNSSFVTLVGTGEVGDDQARDTTFTILASSDSIVSFNWAYSTTDEEAFLDPARFLKGVTPLQFSDNSGGLSQSGSYSNSVAMGQSFGFSVLSTDSFGGPATLTISNFNVSAVPEPGSLAMLTAGLMVVVAARKRKQS